jgi:5-methylcytosine-specific restriction endonuclease McrA
MDPNATFTRTPIRPPMSVGSVVAHRGPVKILNPIEGEAEYTSPKKAGRFVKIGWAIWEGRAIRFTAPWKRPWAAGKPEVTPDNRYTDIELCAAKTLSRYEAERRERERCAPGDHTDSEWREIVKAHGNHCLCCGIRYGTTPLDEMTKDHVVPLSKGGSNLASNLQPLCRPCNSRKGTREIDYRGRSRRAA